MNSEKTTLPSLRNIEWRTVKMETNKINQVWPYVSTWYNQIKWTNLCQSKISLWKNCSLLKKHEEKIKTRMGNLTGNADKKSTKTGQNDKTIENAGICRNKKEKATQEKIAIQLEEINQKVLAKERRLKRYRQRVKQYRQNKTFQNNERKFCQQLGGDDTKICKEPDAKETKRFWTEMWQPKTYNQKAEWINIKTRESEGLEEGPKAEIHIDLLKMIIKNI